jgi:hypothetical protein
LLGNHTIAGASRPIADWKNLTADDRAMQNVGTGLLIVQIRASGKGAATSVKRFLNP